MSAFPERFAITVSPLAILHGVPRDACGCPIAWLASTKLNCPVVVGMQDGDTFHLQAVQSVWRSDRNARYEVDDEATLLNFLYDVDCSDMTIEQISEKWSGRRFEFKLQRKKAA